MVFRKILAILFGGMILCTSLTTSAYAETTSSIVESEVAPAYEIADRALSDLSISGNTAYCTSNARGNDIVCITAEQTLQKQGFLWIWGTYDGAKRTKTVYTSSMSMSNTKTSLSSGKYRVKTVFKLTDKQGETETITTYSDTKSV